MEEMIKNLVKEAVLEALVEFSNYGLAVADANEAKGDDKPKDDEEKKPIRPKPNLGNSGFSLR